MINCDDLGMHISVNEGICDILAQGIIQSTSMMAPGNAFEDAIHRLKSMGIDHCGVHLTLNSEYPKLPVQPILGEAVASLCDSQGQFLADPLQSKKYANIEHIRLEFLAQIAKIENAGMRLTHIDGHMFCYDHSVGGQEIAAVAKAISLSTGLRLRWLNPDRSKVGPKTHFIWEGFDDQKSRFDHYSRLLASPISGIEEIIIHPAKCPLQLAIFTSAGERRISDYQFFSSEKFRDIVCNNDLKIFGHVRTPKSLI